MKIFFLICSAAIWKLTDYEPGASIPIFAEDTPVFTS